MKLNHISGLICGLCIGLFAPNGRAETLRLMGDADVVFLGEVHDNPAHHLRQAELIKILAPTALVFEMLTPGQADAATDEARTDLAVLNTALDWTATGWPDFAMYGPLFQVIPEAKIYGAAVLREQAQQVMQSGAAAVFGTDAAQFGLDQPLPQDEQASREQAQFAAHCDAMPMEMMAMMVDFQRLRDANIARAALKALHETGGPVVVITGNGHARMDHGAPYVLAVADDLVTLHSFGQFETHAAPDATVQFDSWEITQAVNRPDPCDAFIRD